MITYKVGLNTGDTGSLVCVSLKKSSPGSNQTATSSYMGSTSLSAIDRVVFLASFPVSGSGTVTNAKLRLANADAMAATATYEARKLLNTFVKAAATWNYRDAINPWNVAGVLTGTDVDPTVIGTGTSPTTGADTLFDISGAGLDAWVQGCLDGSISVPALIVSKLNDTTSFAATQNRIRTDTAADTKRPVLTFDFTPATPPSLSVSDVLCTKQDGTVTVEVSLSEAAPVGGCSVDYATQDSTATAPAYYTGTSGTLTFAEGETTKNVTVSITA